MIAPTSVASDDKLPKIIALTPHTITPASPDPIIYLLIYYFYNL